MLTIRTLHESDGTYSNYRIPGMVITRAGAILTYFEARRTAGDWAHMDILLCHSEDGGESFSEPIVLAWGTEDFPTVNNPVCIAGADGVLHFLYCRNYTVNGGDIFYRRSADDGRSWSEPVDIMAATRPENHNVFATGPCHGICTDTGMLLVPVWMVPKEAGAEVMSHHPAVISTLYSRDNGDTWQLGEIIPASADCPDPSETQAAQLSDGRIWLNVRTPGTGCRAATVSETGTGGWRPLKRESALPDPACCGSVTTARWTDPQGEERRVLLAVNCADTKARVNLTCRASIDDGATWPYSLVIEPGDAGYSDIAAAADGTVYVLYEQKYGIRENLAKFSLNDLIGG